ncbi:MAG: hypothetical protein HZB59_06920 [Ignavibacteriales bacterium]|nr:hypothetical protein [Ignavibacteriales bacterium]
MIFTLLPLLHVGNDNPNRFNPSSLRSASQEEVRSIAILDLNNEKLEIDEPYSYGITRDLIADITKTRPVQIVTIAQP